MAAFAFNTEIKAPRRTVWDIFSVLPAYENWNPFIVDAVGTMRPGIDLTLKIALASGATKSFRPRVESVDIGKKVVWSTGNALFSRKTTFTLEEKPNTGATVFKVEVIFLGLLARFRKGFVDELETGYRKMAAALLTQAEARPAKPAAAKG